MRPWLEAARVLRTAPPTPSCDPPPTLGPESQGASRGSGHSNVASLAQCPECARDTRALVRRPLLPPIIGTRGTTLIPSVSGSFLEAPDLSFGKGIQTRAEELPGLADKRFSE